MIKPLMGSLWSWGSMGRIAADIAHESWLFEFQLRSRLGHLPQQFYRVLEKPSKCQGAQTEKNAENCIYKSLSWEEMLGFAVEYLSFEAR